MTIRTLIIGTMLLLLPAATVHADLDLLLDCPGTPTGSVPAAIHGLRYLAPGDFTTAVVAFTADTPGEYTFDVELRRSVGFTTAVEQTVSGVRVVAPGDLRWSRARIGFGTVTASPGEAFTLKITSVAGPGVLSLETFAPGGDPCPGLEATVDSTGPNPAPLADPAGFKLLLETTAPGLVSLFTADPPRVDGRLSAGEWDLSSTLPLSNGFIAARNTRSTLYLLVDVTSDTAEDLPGSEDVLWMTVDVDRDGAITEDVDINYRLNGMGNLRYEPYTGSAQWGPMEPETFSSRAAGFGCFLADGSRTVQADPFMETCDPHRIWELGIDLAEIEAAPGDTVRVGLRVQSLNPSLLEKAPADFDIDFSKLIPLSLGRGPFRSFSLVAGQGVAFGADPIEITQAVQNLSNTEPLVEHKDTAVRVYARATTGSGDATVYLYAMQGGRDLDGSPLSIVKDLPTSIDREVLDDTVNFELTHSDPWTSGPVSFHAKIRDYYASDFGGSAVTAGTADVDFQTRAEPLVYVFPVNTGTNSSPVFPTTDEIAELEDAAEEVFPVAQFEFWSHSYLDLGSVENPTKRDEVLVLLVAYYANLLISWSYGGGTFDLPDQIFGVIDDSVKCLGIANAIWGGGAGVVAQGNTPCTSGKLVMAHEFNHNWDKSPTGFWGRHVDGCGADDPDGAWPYADDSINQIGMEVDWWNGLKVIPGSFPDLMSYCTSGQSPLKWISPYRWEALWTNTSASATAPFPGGPEAAMATPGPVYEIRGRLFSAGGGELDPVVVTPGLASNPIRPGSYRIEILGPGGIPQLAQPFFASFTGPEGEARTEVPFWYMLPAGSPGTVTAVRLMEGMTVLDVIPVSTTSPLVSITSPNGGESLDGPFTVTWTASDADGDPLAFSLFYSADGGSRWVPLAHRITDTFWDGDSSLLPGGTGGVFRVVATDGYRTVQDDSDAPITGEPNPPADVFAHRVHTGPILGGEAVRFRAIYRDREDVRIPDPRLVWHVDGNVFATGERIAASFPSGMHTIDLTVVDSDGMTGSHSISIDVLPLCDGPGDPEFPSLGNVCISGVGECAAPGRVICTADLLGAECNGTPGMPVAETCDNLDNDCDGTTDGYATACGVGECAAVGNCTAGSDSCSPGAPQPESCDALDNDCDGVTDAFATACGIGECASSGNCTSGSNSCTPGAPAVEICDALDNDCDGATDAFATVCGVGECASVGSCTAGSDSCAPGAPQAEICDALDNDCDGVTDEDGDLDGVGVCADCDDWNSLAISPPAALTLISAEEVGPGGPLRLRWSDQRPVAGSGTVYDVFSGDFTSLIQGAGFGGGVCLAEDTAGIDSGAGEAYYDYAGPPPPPGDGIYFMIRAQNSCPVAGTGSYGTPERDSTAGASSSPCL